MKYLITLILWTLIALPTVSQTTLKGGIKSIVDKNGDTLIVIPLQDAKKILSDLLDYRVTDSLLNLYMKRDSLNTEVILLKEDIIKKLNTQNKNNEEIIKNLEGVISNKDTEISLKDNIIEDQKKDIRNQRNLKRLGFVGCVVLPIITLIIAL